LFPRVVIVFEHPGYTFRNPPEKVAVMAVGAVVPEAKL
jgi:hypothetical protein